MDGLLLKLRGTMTDTGPGPKGGLEGGTRGYQIQVQPCWPGRDTKLTRGCARQLPAGPSTHRSGFNAQDATVARGVSVSAPLRAPLTPSADLLQRPPDWLFSGSGSSSNHAGLSPALGAPPTSQDVSGGVSWFHVSLGAVCGGGGSSHVTRRREAVTLTSGRPLSAKWGQCWPLKDP